ncbi:hypothetical protein HUT16_01360 [Kitasatospora sp. NA04385]|uniref:hypothetical protein n=1 Tax=Kitasatospora sp. NA04385 TaxID=2742135 RepID=UPI0015919E12|nr:hypothetical protein [Kitasatospora sp. NA04385]QKW17888.1 hypothetical protein HUT16_01360 [Kitasatospora sp. NA04385]
MPMKTPLTAAEYEDFGAVLTGVRNEFLERRVRLENAYARTGPDAAAARLLKKAIDALDEARCELDRQPTTRALTGPWSCAARSSRASSWPTRPLRVDHPARLRPVRGQARRHHVRVADRLRRAVQRAPITLFPRGWKVTAPDAGWYRSTPLSTVNGHGDTSPRDTDRSTPRAVGSSADGPSSLFALTIHITIAALNATT